MATHAAVLHSPTKQQIAKALAGGMPAELSKSPLPGILGVILGAAMVTLAGPMLTLGLADLKGSANRRGVHDAFHSNPGTALQPAGPPRFPMNFHELSFPEELPPAPGEKS